MRQLALPLSTGPDPTFDNFLPSHGLAAWEYLQGRPLPADPVYLWGGRGSGKSHLLAALSAALQGQGQSVLSLSPHTLQPCAFDDRIGAVVIDDCEQLSPEQQHEAFAVFVEATTLGIPVIAAGRVPPVDLPVRDDLRTRLGWGLVYHLSVLTDDEMRAVLRLQAEQRGVCLTDEALDYLLHHFQRDLSALSHLVQRLDVFALSLKRAALTVPLMKRMLLEDGHPFG